MITLFSTPKPFQGHINIIQRNAIKSWTLLHPDIEIILLGDEEGTAEVCKEYNIRHAPVVRRSPSGAKYLDLMFAEAQRTASHPTTCYVNCDIILMSDFCAAVSAINAKHQRFLMIGQRWNTPITQLCNFSEPGWQSDLQKTVGEKGHRAGARSIDYFVFPRGLYDWLPPMVIGRCWWDHWLIWKAGKLGAAVFDASPAVMAIHQSHDYSYDPQGFLGTIQGEEALENIRLAGGKWHLHTMLDARYEITPDGTIRSIRFRNALLKTKYTAWDLFINQTFEVRKRLGLRRRTHVADTAERY
jgi:hypothetical protein